MNGGYMMSWCDIPWISLCCSWMEGIWCHDVTYHGYLCVVHEWWVDCVMMWYTLDISAWCSWMEGRLCHDVTYLGYLCCSWMEGRWCHDVTYHGHLCVVHEWRVYDVMMWHTMDISVLFMNGGYIMSCCDIPWISLCCSWMEGRLCHDVTYHGYLCVVFINGG